MDIPEKEVRPEKRFGPTNLKYRHCGSSVTLKTHRDTLAYQVNLGSMRFSIAAYSIVTIFAICSAGDVPADAPPTVAASGEFLEVGVTTTMAPNQDEQTNREADILACVFFFISLAIRWLECCGPPKKK